MTEAQTRSGKPKSENVFPSEFAEAGKKQLDAFIETQRDFLNTVEEMNRAFSDRAQSETRLVMDFMEKLAAARSFPEAAAAWQECMSRQLEMIAEDGRRLVESSNKAMTASTRLLNSGGVGFGR